LRLSNRRQAPAAAERPRLRIHGMKCVVHLMLSAFMVEREALPQAAGADDPQAARRSTDGDEDKRNATQHAECM